jgi:SM-20-related protein
MQTAKGFAPRQSIAGWLGEQKSNEILAYAIASEARYAPSTIERDDGTSTVDRSLRDSWKLLDLGGHGEFIAARILDLLPRLDPIIGSLDRPIQGLTLELVAHGDGAHFQRHIDTYVGEGADQRRGRRRLSLVYYLNQQPKRYLGGALRFYTDDAAVWQDVIPDHDLLVCFPSTTLHGVERVQVPSGAFAHSRFAINGWLYD